MNLPRTGPSPENILSILIAMSKYFDHFQRLQIVFVSLSHISRTQRHMHTPLSGFTRFYENACAHNFLSILNMFLLLDLSLQSIRFNVSLIMIMITMIRITLRMFCPALAKQLNATGMAAALILCSVSAAFLAIWQTKHQIEAVEQQQQHFATLWLRTKHFFNWI